MSRFSISSIDSVSTLGDRLAFTCSPLAAPFGLPLFGRVSTYLHTSSQHRSQLCSVGCLWGQGSFHQSLKMTPRTGLWFACRLSSLACCSLWGRKESDTTERLNSTEANWSGVEYYCLLPRQTWNSHWDSLKLRLLVLHNTLLIPRVIEIIPQMYIHLFPVLHKSDKIFGHVNCSSLLWNTRVNCFAHEIGSFFFSFCETFIVSLIRDIEYQVLNLVRLGFDSWFIHLLGEGNGNPLKYSCLENPMDRGAW